ncbi:hypothetical protein ACIL2W_004251 [Vibrio parahaemolyticus]|nr:hypothetical protein [Vibrio parahaemolyticus]HAS6987634.1 hypothetical protein [Vibrio parahaemolyticus]HCG7283678.1 hypothetical protein [Vibrio parahaemolyticus]
MELELTDEQVQILLHLIKTEMSGLCGDVGYAELSKIRNILERQLDKNTIDEPSIS